MTCCVSIFFWDEDGKCLAQEKLAQHTSLKKDSRYLLRYGWLDEAIYHEVQLTKVPAGFVTVPVYLVSQNGQMLETKLLACSVGMEATAAINHYWKRSVVSESKVADHSRKKDPALISCFKNLLSGARKELSRLGCGEPASEMGNDATRRPKAQYLSQCQFMKKEVKRNSQPDPSCPG